MITSPSSVINHDWPEINEAAIESGRFLLHVMAGTDSWNPAVEDSAVLLFQVLVGRFYNLFYNLFVLSSNSQRVISYFVCVSV